MTTTDFGQPDFTFLVAVFAAGVGMVAGGLGNVFFGRSGLAVRAAVAVAACAIAGAGAWLVADSDRAAGLATLAAVAAFVFAGSIPWFSSLVAAVARRPNARWGGVAAAGVITAVGAVVWYDVAFEAAADRAMGDLAAISERPPTRQAAARPTTDRGTPVAVMEATDPRAQADLATLENRFLGSDQVLSNLIRRQPADDRANCHGWVFTGGRYWVGGAEVDRILSDNGYRTIDVPRPGDLVVYRQDGAVAHTAIVRYVTAGMPILVEGKWGSTGVYLHAADASVYGTDLSYYRAERSTHILAGLDVPPDNAGGQ